MITRYRVLRHTREDDFQYSPQEEVVKNAIFELAGVGDTVDREEVISKLEAEGKLADSKQPVHRIVGTYQRQLILRGLIDVEKEKKAKGGPKSSRCPHCNEVVYLFRGKLLAAMPEIEDKVNEIVDEVEAEVADVA